MALNVLKIIHSKPHCVDDSGTKANQPTRARKYYSMKDLPGLVNEIVRGGSRRVQLPTYPEYAARIEHRGVRQEWRDITRPFGGDSDAWRRTRGPTGALEHLAPLILVSLTQADPVKSVWFSSEGFPTWLYELHPVPLRVDLGDAPLQ